MLRVKKSTNTRSEERKKKVELCGSVSQNNRAFLQGNDVLSGAKEDFFYVFCSYIFRRGEGVKVQISDTLTMFSFLYLHTQPVNMNSQLPALFCIWQAKIPLTFTAEH